MPLIAGSVMEDLFRVVLHLVTAFVQMVAQLARGFAKRIADRNIRVFVGMILAIIFGDFGVPAGHAEIDGGMI
jgi:hypothetical protein